MKTVQQITNEAQAAAGKVLAEERYVGTEFSGVSHRATSAALDVALLEMSKTAKAERDQDWILAFVCALGYDARMFAPVGPEGIPRVLQHYCNEVKKGMVEECLAALKKAHEKVAVLEDRIALLEGVRKKP